MFVEILMHVTMLFLTVSYVHYQLYEYKLQTRMLVPELEWLEVGW